MFFGIKYSYLFFNILEEIQMENHFQMNKVERNRNGENQLSI